MDILINKKILFLSEQNSFYFSKKFLFIQENKTNHRSVINNDAIICRIILCFNEKKKIHIH